MGSHVLHGRSRWRSMIAGAALCRCGEWLHLCPALRPRATDRPTSSTRDGPTVWLHGAPLLTAGQRERTVRECRDML